MKLSQAIILVLFTFFFIENLQAQDKVAVKSYSFAKGEVLDIIFLQSKSNVDSLWKVYRNGPMPLAAKLGHKSLQNFEILEPPTQGNYHPTFMIIGTWPNLKDRIVGMEKIENEIEGFHELRRGIWSKFDMTYYEMEEALSFEVKPDRYNVATAYWKNGEDGFENYIKEWEQGVKLSKGELLVDLQEGKSPFGYHYQPDYLSITSWTSKEAFESFYNKNLKMDHRSIQHVNQFRIQ